MTKDEFLKWMDEYTARHGMSDRDTAVVAGWKEWFCRRYTLEEATVAGRVVSEGTASLRFVENHRHALVNAIDAMRSRKAAAAGNQVKATGCPQCRGMGVVVVPHPGLEPGSDPPRWREVFVHPADDPRGATATAGTACDQCEVGRRTSKDAETAGRPMMSFAGYELRYGNWREILFEREQWAGAAGEPSPEAVADVREMLARRKNQTLSE